MLGVTDIPVGLSYVLMFGFIGAAAWYALSLLDRGVGLRH
jgi:hypothetical protein